MEKVLEVATSISTPPGLGGLVAAIVFFIFRQIVAKDFFRQLTSAHSVQIITLMIERLFILALVAMILGVSVILRECSRGHVRRQTMSALRKQPEADLAIRGMSGRTGEAYVGAVAALAKHYGHSPDRINPSAIFCTCLPSASLHRAAATSR